MGRQARVLRTGIGRGALPFRAVNVRGEPGYLCDVQRHHLLPCQMLYLPAFEPMLRHLGRERIGFDDFRRNGLLLPCSIPAAQRTGLPLHRGPHRDYNAMVIERVGRIEAQWANRRSRHPASAMTDALASLSLLQRALRRRLLDGGRSRMTLNRRDPFNTGQSFAELDAMAEQLWIATASCEATVRKR